MYFEETTGTLLSGDLFSAIGPSPALTTDDIVGPAITAEDGFLATCLTPATAPTKTASTRAKHWSTHAS